MTAENRLTKSKRIFYYDMLRALAIIGIVFCHASLSFVSKTDMDINSYAIASFFDCLRDFSIPIFVMLSGALLIGRKETVTDFFKKRLSRLFMPFIFWVAVYCIYSFAFIKHGVDLKNALDIFLGTSGTMGVIFWFIWMILISYIGIFFINYMINWGNDRWDDFDKKLMSVLVIISVIYITIVDFGLFNPYTSKIIYFISFLSYIVVGYFISNINIIGNRINMKFIIASTLSLFVLSYLYYILGYVVPHSLSSHQFVYLGYFNLLILFISVNLFTFFKYFSKTEIFAKFENNMAGNMVKLISQFSFGIYLSHYIILILLKNHFSAFIDYTNPLVFIPLLVFIALIASLLISWIIDRIPYLNYFSAKG